MDDLFGDWGQALSMELSAKWPHKCDACGRFVKHDELRGGANRDGEYSASAHCEHCGKRTGANPI